MGDRNHAHPRALRVSGNERPVVGYAPGVYDLFHIGHLSALRHAQNACEHLIAGVLTDDMARAAKGRRPVVPQEERLEIVRALSVVDDAVLEDMPTKLLMWERLRFDVMIKGDDWRNTRKGDALERDMASVGVSVVYFPYTQHTSSTVLRAALDRLG